MIANVQKPPRAGRWLAAWAMGIWLLASPVAAQDSSSGRLDRLTNQWRSSTGVTHPRSLSLVAKRHSGHVGETLVAAGDLNGDSLPDFLFGGGRGGTSSEAEAGAVFLVLGSRQPTGLSVAHVFEGPAGQVGFGRLLAVGPDSGPPQTVFIGRPDKVRSSARANLWQSESNGMAWHTLEGPSRRAVAGLVGVALPGDVNGDGRNDLILACQDEAQASLQMFAGNRRGFSTTANAVVTWPTLELGVGMCVHAVGDFNRDGLMDLLVGLPGKAGVAREPGRLGLLLGSAAPWSSEFAANWRGREPGDEFGATVAVSDLTGDTVPELIVGAPGAAQQAGRVVVFRGRGTGWEAEPLFEIRGEHPGGRLGMTLAVGRLRGRAGPLTLALGAPGVTNAGVQAQAGLVYLAEVPGLHDGPVGGMASLRLNGAQHHAEMGGTLLIPGDLDGDGCDDLVVGLHRLGHSLNNAGRVEILFGSADWPPAATFHPTYPNDPYVRALARLSPGTNGSTQQTAGERPGLPWSHAAKGLVTVGLGVGGLGLWRWRRHIEHQARERERQRIARDLHDELGGHLDRLGRGENLAATEAARSVTTGIERTIWSLHPDRRTLPDLACGLTDLTENLLGDTAIRRRFEFPLELPAKSISPATLDAAYRAAQEALTNVRKHSRATEVIVGLHSGEVSWEVFVTDNGVGLPSEGATSKAGLGLAGMAARLREAGGTWSMEANATGGVTIRLTFPWRR